MATPTDALYRLAEAFQQQFDLVDDAIRQQASARWMAASNWRSDSPEFREAVDEIVALLAMGQRRVSEIEIALQQASARSMGKTFNAALVTAFASVTRDPEDYIASAANPLYAAIAAGTSFRDGLFASRSELQRRIRGQLVDQRYSTIRSLNPDGARYRRVLGMRACKYCMNIIGDGSQTFRVEPEPLHPLCNCGISMVE